jgi:hypothetical protein
MDKFAHIRMILGFILSLSIAHLLRGVTKFIVHPTKSRPYWIHLLWALYIFLALVYFWWWEYRLGQLHEWTFAAYSLVIFYIVLYYIICFLLFPEDLSEYEGYKDYFFARKQWFYGMLGTTFLVDMADTFLKGEVYFDRLGPEYPIRVAAHFLLCMVAIRVKNERFHGGLVILFLLYNISWILRNYFVE